MGIAAYRRTITKTESPRQIERRLLMGVTAELEKYRHFDELEKPGDKLKLLAQGLREAVWKNERIWMTFKNDLVYEANALPPNLRASLISLGFWVENHSQGVLAGTHRLEPLISVNRSIIDGLAGSQR
ncbi:MAG: flaF protein [Alphaproteobacteria bacterium]|nr:MAG: flaF protein [Alphaproteobacteria bacterium]